MPVCKTVVELRFSFCRRSVDVTFISGCNGCTAAAQCGACLHPEIVSVRLHDFGVHVVVLIQTLLHEAALQGEKRRCCNVGIQTGVHKV